MIKFEEHDDRLFRMLDKPVPLTPDAEMPCLVRLIQDDSPMGRYNRDAAYFDVIGKLFVAQKIKENPFYSNTLHAYEKNSLNQDYCIASIHTLEIIGYQAEEGSRWWALYQMMQGKKVCSKNDVYIRYLDQNKRVCLVSKNGDVYQGDYSPEDWLYYVESTNCWEIYWEIYEEPKPEPQYKVGDWVEYRLDRNTYYGKICNIRGYVYYLSVTTEEIPKDQARAIMLERIIRKLAPSQVVITIGCLKGTVAPVSINGIHLWFHLVGINRKTIATIRIENLDTHTRELVESLLESDAGG